MHTYACPTKLGNEVGAERSELLNEMVPNECDGLEVTEQREGAILTQGQKP
jgi:hypothetical protein